jgi:MoaA/NifB/PqqE/SkfB family radical SAM enzyme
MKRTPRFAHLVLKPTLACTARCETCSTRKRLHGVKIKEPQLGIAEWKRLFEEANSLGLSKLTISGGEPTLYKDLLELIDMGNAYGWELGLNTNGSLIDRNLVMKLKEAGLDLATISLYSATPEFHDRLRNHPGLWNKATEAIKMFVEIREQQDRRFRVNMQTLFCRDNFLDFPERIRLAYNLGVCGITFSYLEADFEERKYLLDEKQIDEFKSLIIPATVEVIRNSTADIWTKRMAVAAVRSIYSEGNIPLQDYARGIYRAPSACEIPSFFSIILANGDVHPCNMVEYTHYPVVGNLSQKTFAEIWQGEEWAKFRKVGFDLCQYCPVPQQVYIPIMRRPELVRMQYLIKRTRLHSLYLPLKRFLFSRPRLLKFIRKQKK